jgi:hypothetical protein
MIAMSRLGRKKIMKKTNGIRKRKQSEAMREMAFAGSKRTGATRQFHPARLTAVSGHR